MRSFKLILLMIMGFLVIYPSSLSAELSSAQLEIIRIAFMNGYANAMQADINTIKVLQGDQARLKQFSQVAVNNYIKKVTLLNKDVPRSANEKRSVYKGSNSMSF